KRPAHLFVENFVQFSKVYIETQTFLPNQLKLFAYSNPCVPCLNSKNNYITANLLSQQKLFN
ncbi:hypothetical protein, partial [Lentilactobacillus parakefiri]|uniref:hypothetical protein n=1 Tax=Lentilactobacillus parakefiri TaxID=152332 RepID=UPI001CDABA6D